MVYCASSWARINVQMARTSRLSVNTLGIVAYPLPHHISSLSERHASLPYALQTLFKQSRYQIPNENEVEPRSPQVQAALPTLSAIETKPTSTTWRVESSLLGILRVENNTCALRVVNDVLEAKLILLLRRLRLLDEDPIRLPNTELP